MKKMYDVKSLAARAPFWLSWSKHRSYEPKILGSSPRRGKHLFLFIHRGFRLIRQTGSPHDNVPVGQLAARAELDVRALRVGGQKPAGADPQLHVLHKQAVQQGLVLHVLLRVVGLGLRVHDALALRLDVVLRLEDVVELVEGGVRHGWAWGEGVYIWVCVHEFVSNHNLN
jgi:hypothetical protein